jgi:transcriptional regulator with XRE-family HTH domain
MSLGERIEQRLLKLGLTQSALSRRAGIPQTTVNGLIRGQSRMTPHLAALARALDTTPAFLMGEVDQPDVGFLPCYHSKEENLWSDLLRELEPADRDAILQVTRSLAKITKRNRRRAGGPDGR